MKATTEISQKVSFMDDCKELRAPEAKWMNGRFQSLSFRVGSDNFYNFYSIDALKELKLIIEKVLDFTDGSNKTKVEKKVEQGAKGRLISIEDESEGF